jgi:hypothetical protein
MRAAARALGIAWPEQTSLAQLLGTLTGASAAELAFFEHCRTLFRGAGYLVLADASATPTAQATIHAAVAAPYAHVTAPLRRLGDRFATEAALAAAAGVAVPAWAADALPTLPALLTTSGRRSGAASRGVVDLAETLVLAPHVGACFDAAVVEAGAHGSVIQLDDPPVRARCGGAGLIAGHRATVQLTAVDPVARSVRFSAATPAA